MLRSSGTFDDINHDAILLDNGLSASSFVDSIVSQASHSTAPSVIVTDVVEGLTPTSARLDSLASFSQMQFNAYAAKASQTHP